MCDMSNKIKIAAAFVFAVAAMAAYKHFFDKREAKRPKQKSEDRSFDLN